MQRPTWKEKFIAKARRRAVFLSNLAAKQFFCKQDIMDHMQDCAMTAGCFLNFTARHVNLFIRSQD